MHYLTVNFLQDYLREQPDNVKSFNIVGEIAQFLNVVYSSINVKTIDLVIQLFSTLNEFCSVSIKPQNNHGIAAHNQ